MIWTYNFYKILVLDKPDFVRGINELAPIISNHSENRQTYGKIFNR